MVDQKLLDAIKQYLSQGVEVSSIKESLMQSGWSERDVNNAIQKVTGQKSEEKKVEEKKIEEKPEPQPGFNKKIIFIAGGIILVLILAVLAYFFLFKVGFSEDIPDDLTPGKLNDFIKKRIEGYNKLSLDASSPLKEAIQNGNVNIIMTNDAGTKIIDAVGIAVENSQITSTAIKMEDPSFDVKLTEKMFDSIIASSDPESVFLEGYAKKKIKIKSYGKENEGKLSQLNNFVNHFFVL